ncbi:hypothetical protein F4808DRAFT_465807 [Astrocystis sublimbata]|nr:hypothetical protein F4808DRAFT_465807 [Astrocystis sublimbata]
MAAVTIRNSFATPLPNYYSRPGVVGAQSSGTATTNTDAPKFAVPIKHDGYRSRGIQYLRKVGRTSTLDEECVPLREGAMRHSSEGDVVRAAALYLLHPINQALAAIPDFRDTIRCLSERVSSLGNTRCDISFVHLNMDGNGNDLRCFAVLEIKRRGVIIDSQFNNAMRTVDSQKALNKHARDAELKGGTLFKSSSEMLIKQAAAYAISNRTRYVALFDWDRLVLIRFLKLDPRFDFETLKVNGVGDYCEITTLKYEGQSQDMRITLLGFLVEAFLQTPHD